MTTGTSALVAFALAGFVFSSFGLFLLMVLVQPIWCLIDCVADNRRGRASKIVWIILLIALFGVANWFYGAFAASGRALRWLTRLAWVFAILLVIAFAAMYFSEGEFRRGLDLEWRQRRGMTAMQKSEGVDAVSSSCTALVCSAWPVRRL